MKKNIIVLTILLVLVTVLIARVPQERANSERRSLREDARVSPQPIAEQNTEEHCGNCPQEKTEDDAIEKEEANKPHGFRNFHRGDFGARLNLTEEQKQKISDLRAKHTKANEKRRADLQKLETQKMEAIKNDKSKDAKKLVDQISKLRAELEKSRIDLMSEISKELTPEQREMKTKLQEIKPQRERPQFDKPRGPGRR